MHASFNCIISQKRQAFFFIKGTKIPRAEGVGGGRAANVRLFGSVAEDWTRLVLFDGSSSMGGVWGDWAALPSTGHFLYRPSLDLTIHVLKVKYWLTLQMFM